MSLTGSLFSKLEAGMSSLLPQHTTRPSPAGDDVDLAELSPRAEHALLSDALSINTTSRGKAKLGREKGKNVNVRSGSDAIGASVTFQEPSGRSRDNTEDRRAENEAYQDYEPESEALGIWRPSYSSEPRDVHSRATGLQLSFFESMFGARPTYAERSPSVKIDQSFKLIERRERQMQRELQHLLDAQDYALEKHLASTTPDDHPTQPSGPLALNTQNGHVVPVRQPKKRHLSKREARLGISRCMSLLSDLKNEEEAYIATALAERKAALSRLRNLSTKRESIVIEMKAIESDRDQPIKDEIGKMERRHRIVCEDILKLEEKLRDLKRAKAKLESKITEAKSARDSELSGYKGALVECDKRINNIMNYPEVSVLELEGLMAQDADLRALVDQHISGVEFLSLRPERRTPPMAKDWWEGEVQVLEFRREAVEKERSALDEGKQLWQDMLARLEEHDQQLKSTFNAMSQYASEEQQTSEPNSLGEILKNQYALCKATALELEKLYDYTEAQGWKLLVTALGAEINYFEGLKMQLGDTLQVVGWADGVVTPRPGTPPGANPFSEGDLLSGDRANSETALKGGLDDELTGSVLRRWDNTDELGLPASRAHSSTNVRDFLGEAERHEDSEHDNDVPPGLLSETRDESDDEHNEVPLEFLSMHSPSPKARRKGKGKAAVALPGPKLEGRKERGHHEPRNGDADTTEAEKHVPLSRQSSVNEVPPDLLSETRDTLD